jgi:hypothetical protein
VKWWRTDLTTAGTCFQNYERPLGCQLPGGMAETQRLFDAAFHQQFSGSKITPLMLG